ncbi:hypothetical protein BDN72DRAFT_793756 [Pluteus cervinus]|uniref:Uncharacterized protein n=1 Tax=Pluteus cervinus TaxID=181527 RepID=A0ACD3B0L5_9AGAR|nr:hypothetical protein BDN72DRAFT_793756 [Pluteus cervinus]
MRLVQLFLLFSLSLSPAAANWFSSGTKQAAPPYTTWSASDLAHWLEDHNVPVPSQAPRPKLQELVEQNWNTVSGWSYDQYLAAQNSFQNLRDSSFDAWDDSRLRDFLLQHGVIEPKGPREKLILLAKQKYGEFQDAARTYSDRASAYVKGEPTGVTDRLSSVLSQASADATRKFHDSEDYIYATWDDNRLRHFLEDKGILKPNQDAKRTDMLGMMKDAYSSIANYNDWSTSYIRGWLLNHNIISSGSDYDRDTLITKMKGYYYDTNDSVWQTWSDNQLRQWLVDHNIIRSNAQVNRDKMMRLVSENYYRAVDTFWDSWSDSQIRSWLKDNGYLRSDAQMRRDELINMANEKYTDAHARFAEYLVWPDARLRAFLREQGLPEDKLPTSRPGLLQEARIRYVHIQKAAPSLLHRVGNLLWRIFAIIGRPFGFSSGYVPQDSPSVANKAQQGTNYATEKAGEGRDYVYEQARAGGQSAADYARAASDRVSETAKGAGDYVRDQANAGQDYAHDRARDAWEGAQATKDHVQERVQQGKDYVLQGADSAHKSAESGRDQSKEYVNQRAQEYGDYGRDKAHQAQDTYEHASRTGEDYVGDSREKVGEGVKRAGQRLKGEL